MIKLTATLTSLIMFFFLLTNGAVWSYERSIQRIEQRQEKGIDKGTLYNKSYALVIGNAEYTGGWDPLPGAANDVKDIAETLKRHKFQVDLRYNLTSSSFQKVFSRFVLEKGQDPDNRLLFYYAGHGHTLPMATGEELGYLVMVDSPLPAKNSLAEFSIKSVDMQSFITMSRLIKAKHVLFLFDSCFSGSLLNMRARPTPRPVSDKARFPVRQFITAGRANEPVPDHSVFKEAFINLLEGRDYEPIPDGYVTGEELGLYLKTKVPQYNPAQHPQYGKIRDPRLDQGDFIFIMEEDSVASQSPPVPIFSRPDQVASLPPVYQKPEKVEVNVQPVESLKVEPVTIAPEKKKYKKKKQKKKKVSRKKNELKKFIALLNSNKSGNVRKGAKYIAKRYPKDPKALAAVESQLLRGYNRKLDDKHHVDAMAWLCIILGDSKKKQYRKTLEIVAGKSSSRKIKKHAAKSLKKLK